MNFKLFSHLIMAHLLSEWWSVLGENSNDGILDSKDQKTHKKVTNNPDLNQTVGDRLNGRNRIQELKGEIEEAKRLYYAAKDENEDTHVKIYGMLKYVQALKIRDWIVDLDKEFPKWLSDLPVDRFIKWLLALKYVEGRIFDDLRNRLQKSTINVEAFANEMYSCVEKTSPFYANLPEVPKPTEDEIPRLCEIIIGGKEERKAACKILISTISGDRTKDKFIFSTSRRNKASSTANTYPIKFYVIITEYEKLHTDAGIGFDDVLKKVKSNPEFKKYNCVILKDFLANRVQTNDSEYEEEQTTTLSTVVIRIGFPINLQGTSPQELEENDLKLKSVMNSIRTDLLELAPKSDGNIFIQDEFMSH